MNNFQNSIIQLVKSGLTGSAAELPQNFDWNEAFDLCCKHQILPLLYYGIVNSRLSPPTGIFRNIELATFKNIAYSHNQLYALDCVFKAFDENGIDYMPLKGALLKYIYPKPEMRPMGDADILIKTEQYDNIRLIMQKCGYSEILESDHELVWDKKGILHVELHKRLIPSYNKDYYEYYGDGWRLAKPISANRFGMSDEDNLIYLFTHYAKHYRDGGIGIRHITDIYVFMSAKPNINKSYVEEELKKLQLLRFYKNTVGTLDVWFNNKQDNEISYLITDMIFGSGSYGTYDAHVLAEALKKSKSSKTQKSARRKRVMNLIFMPYSEMTVKYPILKKCPVLLPFMWVVRWLTAIFCKKDNIKKQNDKLKIASVDNVDDYGKRLEYAGLDFNFKE